MSDQHIAVVGGSIAGLAAACALADDGHRVTILEGDSAPLPGSPLEAFEHWERRGAPQARHSHAFLARLHNLIRDRAPELLARLLANGAELMRFEDIARSAFPDAEFSPEDDEITMLACRRITFEWVLRKHVQASGRVQFRDGARVEGLIAQPDTATGIPRVTGVRIGGGSAEPLAADLVIDASGRRSKLAQWLRDIGAGELRQESEPCGIFYSSRFYRVREGATAPQSGGPIGADLGYLKYGIFQGDSGIFSVTLAASPDDDELRRVLREPWFEATASLMPVTSAWVDTEVAEPISDVHAMARLENTRRFFVEAGRPLALGLFPVGDALIHTNPITGRGCTLAFVGAYLLADAWRAHAGDPLAFARTLDADMEREVVPWYEAMRMQDRDSIEVGRAQRTGEDPFQFQRQDGSVEPRAYVRSLVREGLVPALGEDLFVLRSFMRLFNLLEAPSDLMARPELFQRVLATWARREERDKSADGPTRPELVARLDAVKAASDAPGAAAD